MRSDAATETALFFRVRRAALAHFASNVFHKVGMRSIAQDAGTGIAALYEIAAAKEGLLTACLKPDIKARLARIEAASRREVGARARLQACLFELVTFDLERPDFAAILRLNVPPALLKLETESPRVESVIEEIVRQGARAGSIRRDLEPPILAGLICALVDGALNSWVSEESCKARGDLEAVAAARVDQLWAMIWPAVCSD